MELVGSTARPPSLSKATAVIVTLSAVLSLAAIISATSTSGSLARHATMIVANALQGDTSVASEPPTPTATSMIPATTQQADVIATDAYAAIAATLFALGAVCLLAVALWRRLQGRVRSSRGRSCLLQNIPLEYYPRADRFLYSQMGGSGMR